ncbi:hypothetical protein ANO11243_079990 [Dothideomycetidae sp. 11243]|nr:hypothetical protein ANO11243_079990 [fungal sp. No.11243]
MADPAMDMRLFQNRFDTFGAEAHPSKKRRSSSGAAVAKSWPHATPTPKDVRAYTHAGGIEVANVLFFQLASAGFYYNPSSKTEDNVNCFHCHVKLDGWEADDIPLLEHLSHSPDCAWAISTSVALDNEDRDPLSETLLSARVSTFGNAWPYEKKRGWKCKTKKLAEAGWCMDPSMAGEDGTTCFYCNLSLDGWEPKDDPIEEHRKRQPDCKFFALIERYAGARPKKSRARTSTASKASRLSIQSTFSEAPSLMSLGDAGVDLEGDTSIGTVTSTTSTAKGRKAAVPKKGGRGKKKAAQQSTQDETENATVLEDSLAIGHSTFHDAQEQPAEIVQAEPAKKATRGKGRPKKTTQKLDEVAELVMESQADIAMVEEEKPAPKAKRGKKRASDGQEKVEAVVLDAVAAPEEEVPVKGKKAKATKGKKAKAAVVEPLQESQVMSLDESVQETKDDPIKPKRGRKPKATKATKKPEPQPEPTPEPVVEMEEEDESANFVIHAEDDSEANYVVHDGSEANVVIHADQDESEANFVVHEQTPEPEEFEPSPTPQRAPVAKTATPKALVISTASTPHSARSHNSSDAENHPPSSNARSSRTALGTKLGPMIVLPAATSPPLVAAQAEFESPVRTVRIPLAEQTPNRSPTRMSPQKLGMLKSATPWTATDVETIFFPSVDLDGQENGGSGVAKKLADMGGQLTSPEKKMTVEQWVRFQALKGEERLKEECERMVWLFEREGTRALGVLGDLEVRQ